MDKTDTPIAQMAHLAGEMAETMVAGQAAGLRILAAEMQALSGLIPGLAEGTTGHTASDAEIEADFDNMPV